MKVLVNGASGYLGGCISKYFANKTSYDLVLGTRKEMRPPPWAPHAKVVKTSGDSVEIFERACKGVDVVINLAGMNAIDCSKDPVGALLVNSVYTTQLLQSAIRHGVKRFIYISTAHVYDSPLVGDINENNCPKNLHPYATSHRAGEDTVRSAHQKGNIEGVIVRLSNAIGAPVSKDINCWMLLVNDICRQVVSCKQIILRTDGSQKRNFVAMKDVCIALSHLISLNFEIIGDGIFNLGGKTIKVIEMAKLVQERSKEIFKFSPKLIISKSKPKDLIINLNYSINKLQATGFYLTGDYNSEIDDTLLMCKEFWGEG